MTYLYHALKKKEQELLNARAQASRTTAELPEGHLEIAHIHGKEYYYHRYPSDQPHHMIRQYIRKQDSILANQLAQRSYNEQIAKTADNTLRQVQRLLADYIPNQLENIYDRLSPSRKSLISPIILPADQFIQQWLESTPDQQNPYPNTTEYYTERGEHVRSKSEIILADRFFHMGIPYKYEAPLEISDPRSPTGTRIIYPDFSTLNKRTGKLYYWEHIGMMGDPDYVQNNLKKVENYILNGIYPGECLILSFETLEHPLNMKVVNAMIRKYLL